VKKLHRIAEEKKKKKRQEKKCEGGSRTTKCSLEFKSCSTQSFDRPFLLPAFKTAQEPVEL